MARRECKQVMEAVVLVLKHGYTRQAAADKKGVARSSVQRALARRPGHVPQPAGRPRKLSAPNVDSNNQSTT
jgi:predicted DNA-binding protein (UPF0251 family)